MAIFYSFFETVSNGLEMLNSHKKSHEEEWQQSYERLI